MGRSIGMDVHRDFCEVAIADGGRAMSVVSIDSHAPDAVIERLKKLPNVLSVKQVRV